MITELLNKLWSEHELAKNDVKIPVEHIARSGPEHVRWASEKCRVPHKTPSADALDHIVGTTNRSNRSMPDNAVLYSTPKIMVPSVAAAAAVGKYEHLQLSLSCTMFFYSALCIIWKCVQLIVASLCALWREWGHCLGKVRESLIQCVTNVSSVFVFLEWSRNVFIVSVANCTNDVCAFYQ